MSYLAKLYLPKVAEARARFEANPVLGAILSPAVDPARLESFFIQFCALGVQMTEPVEAWIRRAGQRTEALGFGELGRALAAHARHEADHHLMMIEDTGRLVARWNAKHGVPLSAEVLVRSACTPGIARYRALHEEVIEGDAPYAQLAIELEIERLSITMGPRVLRQCRDVLGADALAELSFLEEHVAVDAGHTKFNELQLERLLRSQPGAASVLGVAGSAALDAYGAFLEDCGAGAEGVIARAA